VKLVETILFTAQIHWFIVRVGVLARSRTAATKQLGAQLYNDLDR
jgi:hypothetical protein